MAPNVPEQNSGNKLDVKFNYLYVIILRHYSILIDLIISFYLFNILYEDFCVLGVIDMYKFYILIFPHA